MRHKLAALLIGFGIRPQSAVVLANLADEGNHSLIRYYLLSRYRRHAA